MRLHIQEKTKVLNPNTDRTAITGVQGTPGLLARVYNDVSSTVIAEDCDCDHKVQELSGSNI